MPFFQIDNQNSNVIIISDWSLCLQAAAGLNKQVLEINEHDWITIDGLFIDGNKNSGGWIGDISAQIRCGIEVNDGSHYKIFRCKIIDIYIFVYFKPNYYSNALLF